MLAMDISLLYSIYSLVVTIGGWGRTVDIVTRYWLNSRGFEPKCQRVFRHLFGPLLGPTQPLLLYVSGVFHGDKSAGTSPKPPSHSDLALRLQYPGVTVYFCSPSEPS